MSFVRVPRRSQSLSGKPKRRVKKKPTWDDTTSDLTVHKLSREEVDRRHKVHQSDNLEVVREQKRQQAVLQAKRDRSLSEGNQTGLLREILYDEKQLNDALAHSDRVMSVVKDLFYDDPKRLKAVPQVTRAPGGDGQRRRGGPISEPGPHTSYLDVLSESVMDPQALNEVQDESDKEVDDEPVFEDQPDRDYFQGYIARMARKQGHEPSYTRPERHSNKENHDPSSSPERGSLPTDNRAINDTAKVKKRSKSRTKGKGQESMLDVTQKTKPEDLNKYLTELIAACGEFDRTRLGEESLPSETLGNTSGFPQLSGYTAFLVQTLTKILSHLNQKEIQLRQERAERLELEEEVVRQRQLIDAITVDMIQSQELSLKIQAEARLQINQMEQRLQVVEHLLVNTDFPFSSDAGLPTLEGLMAIPERDRPTSQAPVSLPASTTRSAAARTTAGQPRRDEVTGPQPSTSLPAHPEAVSAPVTTTLSSQPSISSHHARTDDVTGGKSTIPQSVHMSTTGAQLRMPVEGHVSYTTGGAHTARDNPPHLSQHAIEKIMTSVPHKSDKTREAASHLPPQVRNGKEKMQFQGNLRPAQIYAPGVSQSDGASRQDPLLRPLNATGTKSEDSARQRGDYMSEDMYGATGSRTVQTNVNIALKGVSGSSAMSSRQLESDPAGVSSATGHLKPIQPAMLLSPPRQKDRRDFIRPPGYQQSMSATAGQGVTVTGRFLAMGGGPASANHATISNTLPTSSRSAGNAEQNGRGKAASTAPSMNNQTHHQPLNLLLNNFTGALEKPKQNAPSIISVDSASTRYMSLPSEHGEANVIRNMLQTDGVPPQKRVGPNGQDMAQHAQNINKLSLATHKDGSWDATAAVGAESPTEPSDNLTQKIATLSKQREEAEARLQQLKSDYGSKGGIGGMERPATSGAEAPSNKYPSRAAHPNTGVLMGTSTPISPISRDPPPQRPITTGTSNVARQGKTIHVSMPKLSELEISATSTPASKRTSLESTGHTPGFSHVDWKTPMKDSPGEDRFFALKAHISSS